MSDQEDELEIGARDFNKVLEIHSKEGYKEGISEGREAEFQTGFDSGFSDGLRTGFARGQLLAIHELNGNNSEPVQKLPCECCNSGLEGSLKEISQKNQDTALILEHQVTNLLNKPTT